ncbi:MAG TPA: OsmC family protein [Oligoflexia bacterium]|nr:OsmC family protein [Oligoflexia bacterium]
MAKQGQTVEKDQSQIINGVDVTQLMENIRAIRQQPRLADFKFRARNRWFEGGLNRATIDGFYGTGQEIAHARAFSLDADEPPVLLGEDRGANPVEYLLTALSACMTTALAYHAAAQGLEIEEISSEYEGDIDMHGFLDLNPNVRKGFKEIRVRFKVRGEPDEAKISELLRKSPVFDVVTNPTPVKITVEKK